MLPTLQIGPLVLPVPGLLILGGLWIALSMSERRAIQHGILANNFYNLVLISLGMGVIGGRLVYVIQYPSAFKASPISLFSINPGLFNIFWGIFIGLLAGFAYGQRKHFHLWTVLDILAPGMAVMGMALSLSHIASGDAFGKPTQLPWGIHLWEETRHPSQAYETILASLILATVLLLEKRFSWRSGVLFLAFLGMTSAAHLFLAGFRGDSILILGGIRQSQLLAWIVLAISLFGVHKRLSPSTESGDAS